MQDMNISKSNFENSIRETYHIKSQLLASCLQHEFEWVVRLPISPPTDKILNKRREKIRHFFPFLDMASLIRKYAKWGELNWHKGYGIIQTAKLLQRK